MRFLRSYQEGSVRIGAASPVEGGTDAVLAAIGGIDGAGSAPVAFVPLTEAVLFEKSAPLGSIPKRARDAFLVELSDRVTIYYSSKISMLYGVYAVKECYEENGARRGVIYGSPKIALRGYKTYLPPRERLGEFLCFLETLIAFGHNFVMIEIGGAMEYKRHPEITEGWVKYCQIFKEYNGKAEDCMRVADYPKNSIHIDNADGGFLTQAEVGVIVDYCAARGLEIIPEVPTLSHADYLLYPHPELAETQDVIPNNACPSNPAYYALVFDVLDEVAEVFHPRRINVCHDEFYVYGRCDKCRQRDPARIFSEDVNKLRDHLNQKGIKTMIWGDKLLPTRHGGRAAYHVHTPYDTKSVIVEGREYAVHGFRCLSAEEYEAKKKNDPTLKGWYVAPTAESLYQICEDVEVINWHYGGELRPEELYASQGLTTFFGNCCASFLRNFEERTGGGKVKGLYFSNWGANDPMTTQLVGGYFSLAYNALAAWQTGYREDALRENAALVAEQMYRYRNYDILRAPHIEITHTALAQLPYESYQYEILVDPDYHRVGRYKITYEDGQVEYAPIYYGIHLCRADAYIPPTVKDEDLRCQELLERGEHIYHPVGTALPCYQEGRFTFTIALPTHGKVKEVVYQSEKEQVPVQVLSIRVLD